MCLNVKAQTISKQDSLQMSMNLAGKQLQTYSKVITVGNMCYIASAGLILLNISTINYSEVSKTSYNAAPLFVISGIIGLTGYVLNNCIAPSYIKKAGIIMSGNTISIPIKTKYNNNAKNPFR